MRWLSLLLVALLTNCALAQTSSREVVVPGPFPLPGTLQFPKKAGPHPGLVLMCGSGPNDRDCSMPLGTFGIHPFKHLSRELAKRGFVVLRYDKRSYVMREAKQFEELNKTVPLHFADDAAAACELLRQQPEVDPKRVYLIAHSQGGTLAPWVAERTALSGIVLLAPGLLPLSQQVEYQLQYQLKIMEEQNTFGILNSKIAETKKLGEQFREIFRKIEAGEVKPGEHIGGASLEFYQESERTGAETVAKMSRLKVPTIIINGTEDLKCPAQLLKTKEKQLLKNPNLKIAYREGMVHELYTKRYRRFDDGLAEQIAEWIRKL